MHQEEKERNEDEGQDNGDRHVSFHSCPYLRHESWGSGEADIHLHVLCLFLIPRLKPLAHHFLDLGQPRRDLPVVRKINSLPLCVDNFELPGRRTHWVKCRRAFFSGIRSKLREAEGVIARQEGTLRVEGVMNLLQCTVQGLR